MPLFYECVVGRTGFYGSSYFIDCFIELYSGMVIGVVHHELVPACMRLL